MRNDGLGSWSTLNASLEDIGAENETDLLTPQDGFDYELSPYSIADILIPILLISILLISIFEIIGNGTVIWFLGFCMKSNPFTTFILHLAVADLGALMSLSCCSIMRILSLFSFLPLYSNLFVVFDCLLLFMYNTGQYLLTAISIDRCVSVVFPLWHRCHRPPHFSTLVCATIWIISFLLTVISMILYLFRDTMNPLFYLLLMNAILCLPLMTVSTLVLFIKVYFRSQLRKKGKALTAILLALLLFLFLAFPFTCILLIRFSPPLIDYNVVIFAIPVGLLCSCLNSSINPLIYFLIGRNKRTRSRDSMKVILQRLFKEEENCREEQEVPVQTRM
ncbi:mas-related G-protein coupled receptor member H-like [Podarcis raffonei]|uniref:mas-related G-protein coupled receptor member H-like n=1 Tax=Podarcis raffonei TaxID=65483 RepID=UPI0023297A73|nr:mas-related G-protein coupled receptor member H-like [Podarcis raffonei]